MPRVDGSKQNKGVNNNTQNKQVAINMEYQNRLSHSRFKSPYFGVKYQQRVIPVRTLNGVQDIWKFNPNEYKQKWSSYDLGSKAVLGLKILDKLGTPIIVRTPWLYR